MADTYIDSTGETRDKTTGKLIEGTGSPDAPIPQSTVPPGQSADGAGAPALKPQSPLATPDETEIGKHEVGIAQAQNPYYQKLHDVLNSPPAAKAQLEKVKDAPNPQDYHKYSMEFASAMAVMGAIAGKFTRAGGTAALSAYGAALKGWQAGNVQAYEEASKQWEQNTKKTIENNNVELQKYQEILNDKKANIEQMMAGLTIASSEYQNKVIFDMAKDGNFNAVAQAVDKMGQANQRLQSSFGQLNSVREDQKAEVKAKVDELNSNPELSQQLYQSKPMEWLKIEAAAGPMGLKLHRPPPADMSRVQSAVDEVGQYKANPATVLSRMPPADRKAFWDQLQEKYPDWSQQNYNAQNVGGTSGARTEANRAANLDIILNSAKAAIPQALEASAAVPRGSWVPVNKAIQMYQAGESDPKLAAFAVANLQIAELWARSMNPTGVMRSSDREIALHNLSTATSPEAYKTVLASVLQAINREKGAVLTTEQERAAKTNKNPDAGSLNPDAGANDGWGQVKVH